MKEIFKEPLNLSAVKGRFSLRKTTSQEDNN